MIYKNIKCFISYCDSNRRCHNAQSNNKYKYNIIYK